MDEVLQGRTISVDIKDEMEKSYLEYSMSVIVGRALPDVRDGLKPVHRRILYTLYENGIFPDKAYRKAADTIGSVLGRYHPHGDAAVYDALVRMAQSFSLRYPLIDGHGNFGSVDGDPAAAYRYTEARMSKVSMGLLQDIDKETINYAPNYDDRLQEPVVLPSRFPNLLVNGSTGIAVGMATNIPPHNMGEVIDAVCLLIDNPEATLDELMSVLSGPDFPTGGIIMGKSQIRAAYGTGRGKITLRARAHTEEMSSNRERIVVTEIPYGVNKARLIESIDDLAKEKRIDQISHIRDESDRDGMRIVIELKRDANPLVVLNQLYSYSQMQETVGVIMLALADGEPKVMTLKEILTHYIKFQQEVVVRRTRYDLKKAQERAHVLDGLKIALDYVDEVLKLIRACSSATEARASLMDRFNLSEIQAAAILAMRFQQLTSLECNKIEAELGELNSKIGGLNEILGDQNKILSIIKEEVSVYGRKFADERRTDIEAVSGEVDIEDLIPETQCVITLTHYGYVKRQPIDVYRIQKRGGRGVSGMTRREEDFATELFVCSTHDHIVFFTTRGRAYKIKGYEIAESSRTGKGNNIINLLPLEEGEKVTATIRVDNFNQEAYLVMLTKNGFIKRVDLRSFKNLRKNGLNAINLNEDDELSFVKLTTGNEDLLIATRLGMAIRFNETNAREMGRAARGVRSIRLKENDTIVGMVTLNEDVQDATILTVSESGFGRKSELSRYTVQARGGKGRKNYNTLKHGVVAGIALVDEANDVIIIADDGIIIRIDAASISTQSKSGRGVKVMRLREGAKVVTLALSSKDDEEQPDKLPIDDSPVDDDISMIDAEDIDDIIDEDDEEQVVSEQ